MDNLEEYIRKNREELDQYTPSQDIWQGIRRNMAKGRSFYIKWISAAAMITVIFATAALFYVGERRKYAAEVIDTIPGADMEMLSETEIYYNTQVTDLYRQASPVLTRYPEIEKELAVDMAHIDSICTDIKKDLKDNISNEEVIEALINNYRLKISILEDMLELINEKETDTAKKEDHEL